MTDERDTRRPSGDLGGPGQEMGAGRERLVMLLAGSRAAQGKMPLLWVLASR